MRTRCFLPLLAVQLCHKWTISLQQGSRVGLFSYGTQQMVNSMDVCPCPLSLAARPCSFSLSPHFDSAQLSQRIFVSMACETVCSYFSTAEWIYRLRWMMELAKAQNTDGLSKLHIQAFKIRTWKQSWSAKNCSNKIIRRLNLRSLFSPLCHPPHPLLSLFTVFHLFIFAY